MKSALLAFLALVVGACASATGSGQPDADPNRPDADPSRPDADPSQPDADPGAPDADTTPCATAPCDLVDQCGCSAATPACDIDFTDLMGNACRAVTVPGEADDTCASNPQCAAGYVCLGGSTGPRSCKEYCDADLDCGTPRGKCVVQLTNNSMPIAGAVVCSSNCDPIPNTSAECPPNFGCDLFSATFNTVEHDILDCRQPGTRTQGQSCSASQICNAGLTCFNNGTGDVCGEICRPGMVGDCTAGTCGGFSTAFIVAGQEYGVCQQ